MLARRAREALRLAERVLRVAGAAARGCSTRSPARRVARHRRRRARRVSGIDDVVLADAELPAAERADRHGDAAREARVARRLGDAIAVVVATRTRRCRGRRCPRGTAALGSSRPSGTRRQVRDTQSSDGDATTTSDGAGVCGTEVADAADGIARAAHREQRAPGPPLGESSGPIIKRLIRESSERPRTTSCRGCEIRLTHVALVPGRVRFRATRGQCVECHRVCAVVRNATRRCNDVQRSPLSRYPARTIDLRRAHSMISRHWRSLMRLEYICRWPAGRMR